MDFVIDNPITPRRGHRERWDGLELKVRYHCTEYTKRATRTSAISATLTRILTHDTTRARAAFVSEPTNAAKLETLRAAQRTLRDHVESRAKSTRLEAAVLGPGALSRRRLAWDMGCVRGMRAELGL